MSGLLGWATFGAFFMFGACVFIGGVMLIMVGITELIRMWKANANKNKLDNTD